MGSIRATASLRPRQVPGAGPRQPKRAEWRDPGVQLMQDAIEVDILAVTTTVGRLEDAQALARELVERRLAACVQVEPGLQSFYRWQGALCDEPEVRLTLKTLPERQAALEAFFAERHPYQLPQFLAVTLRASAAYGAWVRAEVA